MIWLPHPRFLCDSAPCFIAQFKLSPSKEDEKKQDTLANQGTIHRLDFRKLPAPRTPIPQASHLSVSTIEHITPWNCQTHPLYKRERLLKTIIPEKKNMRVPYIHFRKVETLSTLHHGTPFSYLALSIRMPMHG